MMTLHQILLAQKDDIAPDGLLRYPETLSQHIDGDVSPLTHEIDDLLLAIVDAGSQRFSHRPLVCLCDHHEQNSQKPVKCKLSYILMTFAFINGHF